ncbi:Transposase [Variovorax sp. YR752]|nr:Transposase [Variovorax sp. YR752]
MPIKELCRKGGFSDATFYKWRAKYGGMDVPDAKRLRDLESENAKLKKLLAEAHLDIPALNTAFGVTRWSQPFDRDFPQMWVNRKAFAAVRRWQPARDVILLRLRRSSDFA